MSRTSLALSIGLGVALLLASVARADPPPPEMSPDAKMSLTVDDGVLTVAVVVIEKVTVQTAAGEVEKDVAVLKKAYERGGDDEKYLAAKFVPEGKGEKATILAVSDKGVFAMTATKGELLWKVAGEASGAAKITFDKRTVTVTVGESVRKFDVQTGKQLDD